MKNLLYVTVFLKKEILELLKMLLVSMKLYSRIDTFNILVVTSEDFVKDIETISEMFHLPLIIYVRPYSTVEEAMMARLEIFNFSNIHIYSKLLYLDIDILVQGDITKLFELEIEDKIYAINEHDLTINSEHHGRDFFDFSKINKTTSAINAGVLLFPRSETIQNLFSMIIQRHEELKKEKKHYGSINQQLLNYYSLSQGDLGDTNIVSNYIKLVNGLTSTIPVSPEKDKNIIIQHFHADSSRPKNLRMKYHLEHLIDIYSSINKPCKNTCDQVQFRQYTWNKGNILFESSESKKLITSWQNGSYECLHNTIYRTTWSNIKHLILFSPDFSCYTSLRLDTMAMTYGKENRSLITTIPPLVQVDEPCLTSEKFLVYFCVFHNLNYLSLVELLLLSAKVFSPKALKQVEFLILISPDISQKICKLINKINIPMHLHFLTINSQHEAGCARLHIFGYPFINRYSKILYLDTDIVVQGDLMRVFDLLKEDKVYAVKEYDVYGPGHGAYFFDFSKIDKKTPSLNSGILLFRNSARVRSIFSCINEHIAALRKSGSLLPGCMDQPFIAYHLIHHGLSELESLTPLAFLAEHCSPPESEQIVLSHFVWPIGNVSHKYNRMKGHLKILLQKIPFHINLDTLEYKIEYKPSFNVLIATTGRSTLQQMLDSLSGQLEERDCLTIVYDGLATLPTVPTFNIKKFVCKVQQFCEPVALGYWGHGIRNKYADLLEKRDFVMHADDDDVYYSGSFENLRNECKYTNTLYIAKARNIASIAKKCGCDIIPKTNSILIGQIGTPCGIIPYALNKEGIWELCYGGDGIFYKQIEQKAESIQFLQSFIYNINPIPTK